MNSKKSESVAEIEKPSVKGKREQILDAALHCFVTQGFHATPTAQISKAANVSTGTLFHYFPDKNTLIDQLYISIKKEILNSIPEDDISLQPKQRFNNFCKYYIKWCAANQEKALFLEQFENSPDIREETKRQIMGEIAWLVEAFNNARSELARDLPDEFYEMMALQIINGLIKLINSGTTNIPADELIDAGLEIIWNMIETCNHKTDEKKTNV